MIKGALMGASAFLLVACNTGGSPPGSSTNSVGGADVVASTQAKMTKATTSLALDTGKEAQAGQVAIADVITYGGPKVTITAPDGWQQIRDDSTPTTRQSLYWHAIAANDPGTPTFKFSTPVDAQGAIVLLSNVAPDAPVDMSNGKSGNGGSVKSASMTTTVDGNLILIFAATDFSNAPLQAQVPGDMATVVGQEKNPNQFWILSTWQGQAGATEDTDFEFPQLFQWVAAQVAIKHGSH